MLWASCGGGTPSKEPDIASPAPAQHGGLAIRISPERAAQVQADDTISAVQKRALEDAELTFAEYESAVLEAAECIRASGGEVTLELNVRGRYKYITSYPAERNDVGQAVSDCIRDHLSVLEQLWAEVTAVPEHEVEAAMEEMRSCLVQRDFFDPPTSGKQEDFRLYIRTLNSRGEFTEERMGEYLECARQVEDKWGLSYFAPITTR